MLTIAASRSFAQDESGLSGTVFGMEAGTKEPLSFAVVHWVEEDSTLTCDASGRFRLELVAMYPVHLSISAVGFASDTFTIAEPDMSLRFELSAITVLAPAEVIERQAGTRMDLRSLGSSERIGAKELKRAACCDLSESFESNATVDVSFSDAISGAKTIRMMGLDGKYAQISLENIPFIRGLSSSSGLTLLPGPWINSINVSKGIGTAVNGPNAMTGQIDLCLLDPQAAPALFTNLYVNNQGRAELNVNTSQRWRSAGDNLIMVQGSMNQRDMDDNQDGFRDQPLTRRFNVMDRWLQHSGRRTSQIILRYVTDGRNGGNTDAHVVGEGTNGRHYRVNVDNEMTDVIAKNGWLLRDSTKSIGMLGAYRSHTLSSSFGDRTYLGKQTSGYGNLVYQQVLGAKGDQLKAGGGIQYDTYEEHYLDSAFARVESMPGLFVEYTRSRGKLTVVAGLRSDVNSVHGTVVSPRAHLRYDIGPLTVLRFSAGHGFRSANPLAESASALASSRKVIVQGPLGLERSWNVGASILHKWKWLRRKWSLSVDAYRSEFTDQVVTDLDRSPSTLAIYMLNGPSYANSLLTDLQVELSRTVQAKVSYRWYDVHTTYDGALRERPFTPRHRGLIDLAYESRNDHWRFDVFTNIFGPARLPSTASNPEDYRLPDRSPTYATLNGQVTWISGTFELYLGTENMASAVQSRQIIAPEDPYGPYFDASLIWGPTQGAMFYGGLRFSVPHKPRTHEQP